MSKILIALLIIILGNGAVADENSGKTLGVIFAFGDFANCGNAQSKYKDVAEAIKAAVDYAKAHNAPVKVIIAGDLAYKSGSKSYADCWKEFVRFWDGMKADILPVPGNHDYTDEPSGAAKTYFSYFDELYSAMADADDVVDGKSYVYRFPPESETYWAIIGFNFYGGWKEGPKNIKKLMPRFAGKCILGFSHPPLMSSGHHGKNNDPVDDGKNTSIYPKMSGFLDTLTEANAAVFIAGHDHDYEQFRLLKFASTDAGYEGIRQFVVGTGGVPLYPDEAADLHDDRTFFSREMHGYLKLTLYEDGYDSVFVSVPGGEIEETKITGAKCFGVQKAQ